MLVFVARRLLYLVPVLVAVSLLTFLIASLLPGDLAYVILGDQATIVPRAFMRQFQLTPWRIVDLADPDPQMYANFHTGSPVALANYSNPELDKLLEHARVTADPEKRTEDYCAVSRLINQEAIWFWTFQNTYYAISSAKLKGLPKIYSGVIDVSNVWME